MAAHVRSSHSPRHFDTSGPRYSGPITPVHSPHHSVASTVSSRTPVHTLSIHEYRKQQNTPTSQAATPVGKTLRRKAAAPALNGSELGSSAASWSISGSHRSVRPLQSSHSAHQLFAQESRARQRICSEQLFRSQSAEPRTQGGSVSSISTTTSTGKVGHFNSRKRLPKPHIAKDVPQIRSQLSFAKEKWSTRSLFTQHLEPSAENLLSSGTRTPQTASTFSLSRFPQPPLLADPSFPSSHNASEKRDLNALSFTSTAPATPPATPATIHYRGTSFDLVNPHDSLPLHDIVTPSKDFGSSEYSLAQTSEDLPYHCAEACDSHASALELTNAEQMAPKRALYGDLGAAHAGIVRRAEDSLGDSNLQLPLPPTPAAVSPSSSAYTSPVYSPESILAPSPLVLTKGSSDSRFSLKALTRSLTKRLGKVTSQQDEQELQDFPVSHLQTDAEGDYSQALKCSVIKTPHSVYLPLSPASPITPTSPDAVGPHAIGLDEEDESNSVRFSDKQSAYRSISEPLSSMVPDEFSSHLGRAACLTRSTCSDDQDSRPYYDDINSIYASSSIYTADGRRTSHYPQSLASIRKSNPFLRYSGMDAHGLASEYNQSMLSHHEPIVMSQGIKQHSATQETTDTISRIIEQYDPHAKLSDRASTQSCLGTEPLGLYKSESTIREKEQSVRREVRLTRQRLNMMRKSLFL